MIAIAGLGSNLGDRLQILQRAIAEMEGLKGNTKVIRRSSFYETEPVEGPGQPLYLNAVVQMNTDLSARELLNEFLLIEKRCGRIRTVLNGPRLLDLDLLFYGQQVIEEKDVVVPHPRLHLRKFMLVPLAEIAPQWIHPVLQKSIGALLSENRSAESVLKMNPDTREVPRVR